MLPSDRRITELDGLRGIAVLLVLAWHFTGMLCDPSQGPIQYIAWRFAIFGQSGVDLFFVLSGFLIIGILVDNRESPNYFRTFYARRALRILPPYLILIAAFWICTATFGSTNYLGHEMPLWSLLTFTQNWVMASISGYGPAGVSATWSLAIEEQFYLFAPALIFILPRRFLPGALISICIGTALARGIYFYTHHQDLYTPDVATPLRLDGFCVGGLVALALRSESTWSAITKNRWILISLALGLFSLAPAYTWFLRSNVAHDVLFYFGHAYLAILYGAILVASLVWSGSRATLFLRSNTLTYIGAISYSLYLFHTPFKGIFFLLVDHKEQFYSLTDGAVLLGALVATFAFCALLRRYIEAPAQKFGKSFTYHSKWTISPFGRRGVEPASP